jgi:O-antigen/teichoic acid export membrane protein
LIKFKLQNKLEEKMPTGIYLYSSLLMPANRFSNLLKFLQRKENNQIIVLYGAFVVSIFLGVGVSVVNTKLLGPEEYGTFKLLGSIFVLVCCLANFGYFNSVGRLVAQKENEDVRSRLIGGGLVIALLVALLMSSVLIVFSFVSDDFFEVHISKILKLFLPFVFVYPLKICIENICQGDNRIKTLSALRVLPQALYLFGAVTIGLWCQFSIYIALSLQITFLAIVIFAVSLYLRPDFGLNKDILQIIQQENKKFGIHVYIGSLTSVATAQIFGVLVGAFVNVTAVGYYSLALMVSSPLAFIGSVLGTTYFKSFASTKKIPKNVFFVTMGIGITVFMLFVVFIEYIVVLLYGDTYKPVINLAYILSGGFFIHGFGDLFNRFLCAHGNGKDVRNGAFATGTVSVVAGFCLTRYFGVEGAAWSKFFSSLTYFLAMLSMYFCRYEFQKKN